MLLETGCSFDARCQFEPSDYLYQQRDGPLSLTVFHDGKVYLDCWIHGVPVCVSARSIAQYKHLGTIPRGAIDALVSGNQQLIEVGAGLSEFVVELARRSTVKPIVIDPLPYGDLDTMLSQAYPAVPERTRTVFHILRSRISLIRNPQVITLINAPLEEALIRHGDALFGTADVVLDCRGPRYHGGSRFICDMEFSLLKQSDPQNVWVPDSFPPHL